MAADDFDDWLRLYGDKAYDFAFRLSGNDTDARELVQEAFVRAFRSRSLFDATRSAEAWLLRILRNIYLDGVRRHEKRFGVSIDAPPPSGEGTWEERLTGRDPDPLQLAEKHEERELVQRALDELPPAYRAAVSLCDLEGLRYEEISRVMDCPVGTVRSRIHKGRLLARKAIERMNKEGSHGRP